MSYRSIVLENFPIGYWETIKIGQNEFLNYPLYWSSSLNTILDELYVDTYVDGYGEGVITATSNSTSPIEFEINGEDKVELGQGKYYTMVAYVKSGIGSRQCAITTKYTTDQLGDTLVQPESVGDFFTLSDSEYTPVYITDQSPYGLTSDPWAAWGIVTDSGSADDYILIQSVHLFEGYPFLLEDYKNNNDGVIINYSNVSSKPIIFGTNSTTVLDNESFIQIENPYNMFIYGTESKDFSFDFWFSASNSPRNRHSLLSIAGVFECYIEEGQIFIDSLGNRAGIKVPDFSKQNYVYIEYSSRKFNIIVNNDNNTSIYLDEEFYFPEIFNNELPQIILGPSSETKNLCFNSSFNLDTDFWESQDSSIQVINSDSYSGSSCLEVTKNSVNNSGFKQSDLIPINSYSNYFLSAYVKIPSGNESSEISLICNLYDSMDQTILRETFSQTVSMSDVDGWKRIVLDFIPDLYSGYAEIILDQEISGTAGQKFLADAILLEKSYGASEWTESLSRSDYMYVSSLAAYRSRLDENDRERRIQYAMKNSSDTLDTKFLADKFSLMFNPKYQINRFAPLDVSNVSNADIDNFSSLSGTLQMEKIQDPTIYSGPNGGYMQINMYGARSILDSYIEIDADESKFDPNNSSIRMQIDFDDTSGDGNILSMYPILTDYFLVLKKESNTIILGVSSEYDGSNITNLLQTTTLSSGLINVGINFNNSVIDANIDGQVFSDITPPAFGSDLKISIGNVPGSLEGCPDYIRNVSIGDIKDFSSINWISVDRYTLRLNGNINVSQRSSFSYETFTPDLSNNTIFTIQGSENSAIYLNNILVDNSGHIPSYNYSSPETIQVEIISETNDAFEKTNIVKDVFLLTYDSSLLDSNYANFSITSNTVNSETLNSPFIPKTDEVNILSKTPNLDARFDKNSSTGILISSNSSGYRYLEFIIKLNSLPNKNEIFSIFEILGTETKSLTFNDNYALSKSGSYTIYIDGIEITSISEINLSINNIYHIFIDFGSLITEDIHFGSDSLSENVLDGSMGRLVLYQDNLNNLSDFVGKRYSNIFSNTSFSVGGGSVSINDQSVTQTYVRDSYGEYFEMENLPKVKIYVK